VSLNAKRLDHLENSLTSLEAVLLWLAEAHAHPSVTAYVLTLKDGPLSGYPLVRLPDLVEPGVRAAHKGEPRSDVDHAVFAAKRDLAFLFHLVMQGNAVWFERERALSLGYLLVVEKLARLAEWAPRKLTAGKGRDREDYLRMAARFADLINSLHGELLVLDAALAAVGRRYLGGVPLLWPDSAATVARTLGEFALLAEIYNDAVAETPALARQRRYRALTAAELLKASEGAVATMTACVVDRARAETLRLVGEDNQAADLMAKYVG